MTVLEEGRMEMDYDCSECGTAKSRVGGCMTHSEEQFIANSHHQEINSPYASSHRGTKQQWRSEPQVNALKTNWMQRINVPSANLLDVGGYVFQGQEWKCNTVQLEKTPEGLSIGTNSTAPSKLRSIKPFPPLFGSCWTLCITQWSTTGKKMTIGWPPQRRYVVITADTD